MFERVLRWRVILGISLGLAAVGLWYSVPAVVVAAMVPVGYVAYSALTSATPVEEQIALERTLERTRTHPGGAVSVTLEVSHIGEKPLPDLRIVDGVPDRLAVIAGSPRGAVGLQPGESASIEYTLRARYGEFRFNSARVRTTGLSDASVYTTEMTPTGEDRLLARLGVDELPLSEGMVWLKEAVVTDRGGRGLEFYATREYHPGDPITRINWRQYAEHRELAIIDYREDEGGEVVVIVDARPSAAVSAGETAPTGIELCSYAASEAIDGLLETQNRVGLVALGISDPDTSNSFGWIPPERTQELRNRGRMLLDTATEAAQQPAAESTSTAEIDTRQLLDRLGPRSQLVIFSPICDDAAVTFVKQLLAAGHFVSVYTPDVTTATTAGGTLAGIERTVRLTTLQSSGATIVNWMPEQVLDD